MVIFELDITDDEKKVLTGIDPMQFSTGLLSPEEQLVVVAIAYRNNYLRTNPIWRNGPERELRIRLSDELVNALLRAREILLNREPSSA